MALVTVTKRARLQIDLIADYLNEHNPAATRRFLESLRTAYWQLSDFPLSGRRGTVSNTRRLIVRPYVLTYRVVASGVEILDIRHGRQRPLAPSKDD